MRRGVLWGCLLLGCSFEATSIGTDSATESGLGAVTTSSTGSPGVGTQVETGPSSLATSGGAQTLSESEAEAEAEAEAESEAEAEAESDSDTNTTTSGDPASSTGEDSQGLSDVGLVARYFLDEAASGSAPAVAFDAAEEPFPLPLEYVENTMHYASAFGHRGLAFDMAGADDGARAPIAESKFEGLEGVTELTFEVVVRLDDAVGSDSRLVHFGGTGSGTATLSSNDPNQLQFAWNDTVVRDWDYSAFSDGVAHVVHLIVDTNAGSDASRVRLLVDGNELPANNLAAIEPGEAAVLANNAIFALGNRNQDRAMQGILFYAAIYGVPISDGTVASHVSLLTANDDSP